MANLIVRNLEAQVISALKQRAAKRGRSAEAEHRALLEEALLKPKKKSLVEVLATMPNVGHDEDFKRRQDKKQAGRVFD